MRHPIVLAILVIGCRHDDGPPHAAQPPAPNPAVARSAPADAPAADAAGPDAAGGEGSDDGDFSFYDREAIGPLHAKMTDQQVIAVLGKPRTKEPPTEEGATGGWASNWSWSGASALMVADTSKGPWQARGVSVSGRRSYATRRGIHVGSARAEVERLYPRSSDDQRDDPDVYVVGSIYGGMLFTFEHDRVAAISIGVFAF